MRLGFVIVVLAIGAGPVGARAAASPDPFCNDLMALAERARPGGKPNPFSLRQLGPHQGVACGYEKMPEARQLCRRYQEHPHFEFADGYPRDIEACLKEQGAKLLVTADGPDSGFVDDRPMVTGLLGELPGGLRFSLKRTSREDILPDAADYDLEITRSPRP